MDNDIKPQSGRTTIDVTERSSDYTNVNTRSEQTADAEAERAVETQLGAPNAATDKPESISGETVSNVAETKPTQNVAAKKDNKTGKVLLWVVAFLLLAGLGTFAYMQWMAANTATKDRDTARKMTEAAQKAQIAAELKLKEAGKTTVESKAPAPQPAVAAKTDDQQIIDEVNAHHHAEKATASAKYNITVGKKLDVFAKANVTSPEGPGFYCITKKVDGIWVQLVCGQGIPPQTDLDKWGIPAALFN